MVQARSASQSIPRPHVPAEPSGNEGGFFCSEYTRKDGKVMRAADYGYKAWRFPRRKPKAK